MEASLAKEFKVQGHSAATEAGYNMNLAAEPLVPPLQLPICKLLGSFTGCLLKVGMFVYLGCLRMVVSVHLRVS